jgi:hypothetical protein
MPVLPVSGREFRETVAKVYGSFLPHPRGLLRDPGPRRLGIIRDLRFP